ncbi:hypothetical protein PINS_up003751 [Pythium insidiosum]|nr:hypothetical protein PINS_up003751 [Pythium insidiosum]
MDTDDIATLMPRTKAAAERTDVNVANLKEYMASSQHDNASLSLSQRTSVMVRNDVRKDEQGFEDIDEFWADDDVVEEKDAETEGDESSMMSEANLSSANVSMISTASEMEVNLSGIDAGSSDDDMELVSAMSKTSRSKSRRPSSTGDVTKTTPPKQKTSATSSSRNASPNPKTIDTPERALQSPGRPSDDLGDVSFGSGAPSPPSGSKRSSTEERLTPSSSDKAKHTTPKSKKQQKQKLQTRRESRDSFGGAGFGDDAHSPFAVNDAALTPLS